MRKKFIKYIKLLISVVLIFSLVAPSYASLSASDGSAFVTKAEFDSALADFNSRLTTFEAGINAKIDSQVTSYLDRNGIWNGKKVNWLEGLSEQIVEHDLPGSVWCGSSTNVLASRTSSTWSKIYLAGSGHFIRKVWHGNWGKSGLLMFEVYTTFENVSTAGKWRSYATYSSSTYGALTNSIVPEFLFFNSDSVPINENTLLKDIKPTTSIDIGSWAMGGASSDSIGFVKFNPNGLSVHGQCFVSNNSGYVVFSFRVTGETNSTGNGCTYSNTLSPWVDGGKVKYTFSLAKVY